MDAPKCKYCHKRHWNTCYSGDILYTEEPLDPAAWHRSVEHEVSVVEGMLERASNTASNRKQRWDRESYNTYMREYMRRKRHAMREEEGS